MDGDGAPPADRHAWSTEAGTRAGLVHALWLSVFAGLVAGLHTLMPYYQDGDTGYHLAVARLTAKYGLLDAFPWTPFSWLAEHYADKELLFHLLLVPLAGQDPALAAGAVGTLLGTLLLTTLYALLLRERVPGAGWWTLLALAISSAFVYRLALVRPHLLAVPLALVVAWSAARRRRGVLAVACLLFPFCYTAWHLPLALVGVVEAARLAARERVDWRGPALAVAALALGVVLHPNFPANLQLFWIQNYTVLFDTVWSGRPGFEMGGEFAPFRPLSLLRYVLLPAAAAVGAAALGWRRRREDAAPLALAATALAFLLLTLRTQRFIEYLAPFAVLALAVAWRPARPRWLAPALVAGAALWVALFARAPFERLFERTIVLPPDVARALQELIPEGEQIVTCEWQLTGEMLLALPERRFLVALDPIFLAVNDAERYRVWYETIQDPPDDAATRLRDTFDARYVVCDRRTRWLPLVETLGRDPHATLRGIVGWWVVFELLPDEPPASTEAGPA